MLNTEQRNIFLTVWANHLNFSKILMFWLFGVKGSLYIWFPEQTYGCGKTTLQSILKQIGSTVNTLSRVGVIEIFIIGKGHRFMRVGKKTKKRHAVLLILGRKCVYWIRIPKFVFLVGINKRKFCVYSNAQGQLRSYQQNISRLKPPSKHYVQGICFRYKFKKLQNFRFKKRRR